MSYLEYCSSIKNIFDIQRRELIKISSRFQEGFEDHHIYPICMSRNDDLENRVLLTYGEHFEAHYFIVKDIINKIFLCSSKEKAKIIGAFLMMGGKSIYNTSEEFLKQKEFFINEKKLRKCAYGKNHPSYGKPSKLRGTTSSKESKQKNRESQLERFEDPEERRKASERAIKRYKNPRERRKTGNAHKGKKRSPESKQNMSKWLYSLDNSAFFTRSSFDQLFGFRPNIDDEKQWKNNKHIFKRGKHKGIIIFRKPGKNKNSLSKQLNNSF